MRAMPSTGGGATRRKSCRPRLAASASGVGSEPAAGPVPVRAAAGMGRTIPALPVRAVPAAAAYYRERFGFASPHETEEFAVLVRDDAHLHLWGATDGEWRTRADLAERPVCSGAESFIAGTGSARIEVTDVDALYDELRAAGVLHRVSEGGVS